MNDVGTIIGNILSTIDAGFSKVVRAIWAAISSVWNVSTDFWWRIAQVAFPGVQIIADLRRLAQWFASRAGIAVWWIIHVLVPRSITVAVDAVTSWISRIINDIRQVISTVYHAALDFAQKLVNALHNLVNQILHWAQQEIGKLITDLRALKDFVTHFLTDPRVLVEWLWNAFWAKARDWVIRHEEWAARWFLARAVSVTVFAARIIEDIIVRIL